MLNILYLILIHSCPIRQANQMTIITITITIIKSATTYIYPDDIAINSLDIADELKELLIKYGFTLEALSNMPSSELAESLGIDQYIAKIICSAARKLSDDNYAR